jgi:protein-L-isoaspartate(D-aspartate) O-methyltransferase
VSSAAEELRSEGDEALGQFLIALRARGNRSQRLLEAVERAPRADFLPPEHVGFAYRDMSLPLPCGQETGRPLAVVAAVAALEIEPDHDVLEIGAGSGWQTALIAGLCRAVASVERWRLLAEAADRRLQRLGFDNAVVAHGDGTDGLPDAAPFDRIIVNAAAADQLEALVRQLRDGGLMLAPVLGPDGAALMRYRRAGRRLLAENLGPTDAPRLASGLADGR